MTDAALDRRSLTLPDWRAALKRRVRRPKMPDRKRLGLLAINVVGAVGESVIFAESLFVPCLILAAAFALDAAVNVRAIRRGEPINVINPKDGPLKLTVVALFALGTAWALTVLVAS